VGTGDKIAVIARYVVRRYCTMDPAHVIARHIGDTNFSTTIPGIRPDLLLKKQADQDVFAQWQVVAGQPTRISPHRRHDVFGAGADAGGPAGGHRFEAGVEAHASKR